MALGKSLSAVSVDEAWSDLCHHLDWTQGKGTLVMVKSLGVVFFRSGGDGGQGGATVDAVGAVVGLEHVGQVSQGGLGQVAAFAVLPLLVALAGRIRSGGVRSRCRGRPGPRLLGA